MVCIGVIGAMEEEVASLINQMEDAESKTMAGMTFNKGKLWNQDAVVVQSGIGKVNMAICTQILVNIYGVDMLINTGVAGGLYKDINVGDITDVVNILNKKELSNYVIKNTISRLKSCFETALEEDIITKNPVKSINTNGLGKSANIRRSLTNDELYWFFRGLTEHSIHDKFLFQLMLTTGIRVGELSALRWKNVDEDFKFITIDSTLTQYYNDKKEYIVEYCTPKTDRIRKIPIKDDVQSLFKQHKTILMEKYHGRKMTLTDEDFVFQKPIKKGMSQEKVQRIIDSIRNYLDKEYGIKLERFTPHYFRHTFATVAIHSDIPSIDIQKIGGWTDGAMLSKVYAHSNEELMTNSINKLNISF